MQEGTLVFSAPVTLKDLLEAGVHFGHQTRRWNPKMKNYIFGERNGIYIIDLQKTHRLLQDALQFVEDLAAQGKTILFVGTKRQAQEAVAEEAQRCGMPYVTERWLGGLLTNFTTVRKSLERMRELETTSPAPSETQRERLTKKELGRLDKERQKLDKNLTGIKSMKTVPDAVFVIDTRREAIAVAEARKLRIPVIGILDTNSDPDEVDVPIPGNDDALRAIRLFAGRIGRRHAHRPRRAGGAARRDGGHRRAAPKAQRRPRGRSPVGLIIRRADRGPAVSAPGSTTPPGLFMLRSIDLKEQDS